MRFQRAAGSRLFPKIVLAFLIVIIPIDGLSLFMNQSGEKVVRDKLLESSTANVHFYLSALETELNRILLLEREYVSHDEDFQRLGTIPDSLNDFERLQTILRIENKLSILKSSSPYIQEIKIYFPRLGAAIKDGNLGENIPQDELDAIRQGMNQHGGPLIDYDGRLIIGMVYPASGPTSFALEVELSVPLLRQAISQMSAQPSSGTLLINDSRNWVVSDQAAEQGGIADEIRSYLATPAVAGEDAGQRQIQSGSSVYLLYFERSPSLGLTLVHYVPEKQAMGALEQYRIWYWVLLAVSLIVVTIFSNLIFVYIHRPMRRLVNGLRQFGKGNLATRLHHKSRDEFQDVYQQFNLMADRIRTLIDEVAEEQIRSERSEIKQLQSQINPHFLYNCLFILLTLIKQEDLENAEHLVKHLGNYFRFITRSGEDEVSLEKEIAHAQAFAGIQSVRFPDIAVEWRTFPADCMGMMVPRLILQPIVENAYLHGLEEIEGPGRLVVEAAAEEPSVLTIRIEDNGTALSDEALRELTAKLDSAQNLKETTGIYNVHRRLQLKYGSAFGLRLSRGRLGGLLVSIRLPITN